MNKTKTKAEVVWPTTPYFTIEKATSIQNPNIGDLKSLNPDFVLITLRVRLTNAIADGKVVAIGSVPGGKGRPKKVFAMTPVTQNILKRAERDGIIPVDNVDKLINVISVTGKSPSPSPSVNKPLSLAV